MRGSSITGRLQWVQLHPSTRNAPSVVRRRRRPTFEARGVILRYQSLLMARDTRYIRSCPLGRMGRRLLLSPPRLDCHHLGQIFVSGFSGLVRLATVSVDLSLVQCGGLATAIS